LLPAGPLREATSRLRQVQAVIVNGEQGMDGRDGDRPAEPLRLSPGGAAEAPRFRMRLSGEQLRPLEPGGPDISLTSLAGRRVHAVAGIGDPARFFRHLRAAGLGVVEHPFADHHVYRRAELAFSDALPLLMTEKDAVKCRSLGLRDAWYLPVSASFPVAETAALRELLQAALQRALLAHSAVPPAVRSI
jgi:tetraacyldisaccharide 4'-kinase